MHRVGWLVISLVFYATYALAQMPDQAKCLAGTERDISAVCTRFIDDINRKIDVLKSSKVSSQVKSKETYLLLNLRGGAFQAMARRQAADGQPGKSADLHYRAINDFDEAIQLYPAESHALLNRGRSRAELSALDLAIQDFDRVIKLDPKNALAFNNRGGAHSDKGNFSSAIADLERAIAIKPNYADALVNRGSIYQHKQDYDRAIADFGGALRNGARDVYVYTARGRVWREKGDLTRAKADFEAALALVVDDKRSRSVQDAVKELLTALQEQAERAQVAERERAALEKLERERAERERAELLRAQREQSEIERAEKIARERAESIARERAALEAAARQKAEREKTAQEKAERDKAARERIKLEKELQDKAVREKAEFEVARRAKIALEKAEQATREKEATIARNQAAREKALRDKEERESTERDKARKKRVALVLGNSDYDSLGVLSNSRNDAVGISKALRELDFSVLHGVDLDYAATSDILNRFTHAAREAEIAIFFFAGHGLQFNEANYLAPVDAGTSDLSKFIKLQSIMEDLQSKQGVRILIIDACRTRPEPQSVSAAPQSAGRSVAFVRGGLARVENQNVPRGMFIAFAATPGEAAYDGVRTNSPFTGALLKHLATPGLELRRLFTRVRKEVVADTNDDQTPESVDRLLQEEFFFRPLRR